MPIGLFKPCMFFLMLCEQHYVLVGHTIKCKNVLSSWRPAPKSSQSPPLPPLHKALSVLQEAIYRWTLASHALRWLCLLFSVVQLWNLLTLYLNTTVKAQLKTMLHQDRLRDLHLKSPPSAYRVPLIQQIFSERRTVAGWLRVMYGCIVARS